MVRVFKTLIHRWKNGKKVTITNDDMAAQLLCILPESYSNLLVELESHDSISTAEQVRVRLLQECPQQLRRHCPVYQVEGQEVAMQTWRPARQAWRPAKFQRTRKIPTSSASR